MKTKKKAIRLWVGVALLVSALLACNLPFGGQDSQPTITPQPPTEEAQPGDTQEAPSPTAESSPPDDMLQASPPAPDVVFEGISFSFDKSLARQALPEIAPSEEMLWGVLVPEHVRFSFEDYLLSDTFHEPALILYPAGEFSSSSEEAAGIIDELERFLAEKPADADHIPFLPFWNAAQVMHAQVEFIEFQNGEGVRFLTQYGQDVSPINNQAVFYTFQGLSDDGAWYVAAILPVNHPILPADSNIPGDAYMEFADNYLNYLQEIVPQLDAQPASSFTPDLELLDSMIGSLLISP